MRIVITLILFCFANNLIAQVKPLARVNLSIGLSNPSASMKAGKNNTYTLGQTKFGFGGAAGISSRIGKNLFVGLNASCFGYSIDNTAVKEQTKTLYANNDYYIREESFKTFGALEMNYLGAEVAYRIKTKYINIEPLARVGWLVYPKPYNINSFSRKRKNSNYTDDVYVGYADQKNSTGFWSLGARFSKPVGRWFEVALSTYYTKAKLSMKFNTRTYDFLENSNTLNTFIVTMPVNEVYFELGAYVNLNVKREARKLTQ